MRDSTHPARLTRARRAALLAVALLLSVVSVAGCTGSSSSPAASTATGGTTRAVVSDCLIQPGATCYSAHAFQVAYGSNIQTIPYPGSTGGWRATPGWDPATGWGSPNAQVLVPVLAA